MQLDARLSEVWPALERVARAEGVIHLGASDVEDAHAALFGEWIERGASRVDGVSREERRHPRASARAFSVGKVGGRRSSSPIHRSVPHAAPTTRSAITIARYALGDDYHDVLDRILRKFEARCRA